MSHRLRVSRRAATQIRVAEQWWLEHRPKAPHAFAEEIARGFELARILPSAGEAVHHPGVPDVRRILLGRIRYHLYYSVSSASSTVEIVALWHTSRGSMPELR